MLQYVMEDGSHVLTTAICKSQHSAGSLHNPSLTLYKRKIMRWNFSKLVTFYRGRPPRSLTCPDIVSELVYLLRRCSHVVLFTVCSHQPFPISPSGKSQLFVQVPSVIEFVAEIAAWKISFSLPAGVCVCVC